MSIQWNIDERTLYVVVAGSHAYGTSRPSSDYDFRGIAMPPEKFYDGYAFTFEQCDQKGIAEKYPKVLECAKGVEPMDIDMVVYDICKFFKLASDCNPNIIELLWTDDSNIVQMHPVFKIVRDNKEMFLSKAARYRFFGYANSQLSRIQTHRKWIENPITKKPERADFGLPEGIVMSQADRDSVNQLIQERVSELLAELTTVSGIDQAMINQELIKIAHIIQEQMAPETQGKMKGYREILEDAILESLKLGDEVKSVLIAERKYQQALKDYNNYRKWEKERNPERAELERKYGYDCKHAMHLVRLMRMAKEILEEGIVKVKRPDAEELKSIRDGAWTYDQLVVWAKEQEEQIDSIYKTSTLPKAPKIEEINELCREVVKAGRYKLPNDDGKSIFQVEREEFLKNVPLDHEEKRKGIKKFFDIDIGEEVTVDDAEKWINSPECDEFLKN